MLLVFFGSVGFLRQGGEVGKIFQGILNTLDHQLVPAQPVQIGDTSKHLYRGIFKAYGNGLFP